MEKSANFQVSELCVAHGGQRDRSLIREASPCKPMLCTLLHGKSNSAVRLRHCGQLEGFLQSQPIPFALALCAAGDSSFRKALVTLKNLFVAMSFFSYLYSVTALRSVRRCSAISWQPAINLDLLHLDMVRYLGS